MISSDSMLAGFKRFNIHREPPRMTITDKGVTFDHLVNEQLGNPEKVLFLVDDKYNRVAIQGCEPDDEEGINFWNPEEMNKEKVHWHSKVLLQKLQQMGNLDLGRNDYRLPGFLLPEENAMFFDLNTAEALARTSAGKDSSPD